MIRAPSRGLFYALKKLSEYDPHRHPSENHPPKPNALGQPMKAAGKAKTGGIFQNVGIFVGIK